MTDDANRKETKSTTQAGHDFSTYIGEHAQNFTGREWVLEKINAWLTNPVGNRVYLLCGMAGTGKTAIASRIAQMSLGQVDGAPFLHLGMGSLAYFHFCQAQSDATLNPLRFVEALSATLANRFPRFAKALIGEPHRDITVIQNVGTAAAGASVTGISVQSLHIGNLSARVAFDWAVRRPLEVLCGPAFDETIVILVDSMDEALGYDPDENIACLLADATSSPQNLPSKVRFLLTSRSDPQLITMLGKPELDLIDNAPTDVEDIWAYVKCRLGVISASADIASRIAEAARGNFLYARYVLDELEAHPEGLADPATLNLPDSLNEVYRQFIRRELGRNRERWDERYRPILGIMTVARGRGLTRAQSVAVAERFYGLPESRAHDALDRCAQYLAGQQPSGPFTIYHQSFRDFLIEDQTFQIFPAQANRAVGEFFLATYQKDAWENCQDYALRYTEAHLQDATKYMKLPEQSLARREVMEELTALQTDRNFRLAYSLEFVRSWGRSGRKPSVRRDAEGWTCKLAQIEPSSSEVKRILRTAVLANYSSKPILQEVGWLYCSDDVRSLYNDLGPICFTQRSYFSGTFKLTSPTPGMVPPKTLSLDSPLILQDVGVLFRIEDLVLPVMVDLTGLLHTSEPVSVVNLEGKLRALDAQIPDMSEFLMRLPPQQ